jgi:hypothetical protein
LNNEWVVDAGATNHMCDSLNLFNFIKPIPLISIKLGDNIIIPSPQAGTLSIKNLTITAIYVPEYHVSLLSVPQLDLLDLSTIFENRICNTLSQTPLSPLLSGHLINGLYIIDSFISKSYPFTSSSSFLSQLTLIDSEW